MFEALVDYIIIGGEIDRQSEPCMIRFICKSENNVEKNQKRNKLFLYNMFPSISLVKLLDVKNEI